jgi:hypothetical protein
VKREERWPLIVWRGFLGHKTSFKFIFCFDFEYRTSRTIKRDTNSAMDEINCLKIFSKTKIIPATYDLSARCFSLEHFFPGTSEFFLVSFGLLPSQPAEVVFSQRFRDLAQRFRVFKNSRCYSRFEGSYTPLSPNGYLLSPCAKQ